MTTEMKNVSDAMKGLSEYYSDTGFIEGKLIKALDASINDLKTNFSKNLQTEIETLVTSVEKSQLVSKKLDKLYVKVRGDYEEVKIDKLTFIQKNYKKGD